MTPAIFHPVARREFAAATDYYNRNEPMAERRRRRLLQKLLSGSKNIRFAEAVACAEAFGFRLSRINGRHHIYVHADIPELVNL
jgi:hypothetical protein